MEIHLKAEENELGLCLFPLGPFDFPPQKSLKKWVLKEIK